MKQENVVFFTESEEEFVDILAEMGTRRNAARVLVFLSKTSEADSHAIERARTSVSRMSALRYGP